MILSLLFGGALPLFGCVILITVGVVIILFPFLLILPVLAFLCAKTVVKNKDLCDVSDFNRAAKVYESLSFGGKIKTPWPYFLVFVLFTLIDVMIIVLTKK